MLASIILGFLFCVMLHQFLNATNLMQRMTPTAEQTEAIGDDSLFRIEGDDGLEDHGLG